MRHYDIVLETLEINYMSLCTTGSRPLEAFSQEPCESGWVHVVVFWSVQRHQFPVNRSGYELTRPIANRPRFLKSPTSRNGYFHSLGNYPIWKSLWGNALSTKMP